MVEIMKMFKCNECDLTFTSNPILTDHLAGKRHKKKLESIKVANEKPSTVDLKCGICDVQANSLLQMEAHLTSPKHLLKTGGGSDGTSSEPKKKKIRKEEKPPKTTASIKLTATNPSSVAKSGTPVTTVSVTPKATAEKKPAPQIYTCSTCGIAMNSKSQYDVHMTSKKHKARRNGNYYAKKWTGFQSVNQARQSYSTSFVAANPEHQAVAAAATTYPTQRYVPEHINSWNSQTSSYITSAGNSYPCYTTPAYSTPGYSSAPSGASYKPFPPLPPSDTAGYARSSYAETGYKASLPSEHTKEHTRRASIAFNFLDSSKAAVYAYERSYSCQPAYSLGESHKAAQQWPSTYETKNGYY